MIDVIAREEHCKIGERLSPPPVASAERTCQCLPMLTPTCSRVGIHARAITFTKMGGKDRAAKRATSPITPTITKPTGNVSGLKGRAHIGVILMLTKRGRRNIVWSIPNVISNTRSGRVTGSHAKRWRSRARFAARPNGLPSTMIMRLHRSVGVCVALATSVWVSSMICRSVCLLRLTT